MGSEDCVTALLEHGASALCRDSQGRTPLHLAASRGHMELLKSLLKAAMKADPLDSMLDHRGYTPTHWAAYHGETSRQEFMSNALLSTRALLFVIHSIILALKLFPSVLRFGCLVKHWHGEMLYNLNFTKILI